MRAFLLDNEMDDFVRPEPGVMNAFGMLGDEANAIEAGKRPLSSMTPVIVFAYGEPWFATGGRGRVVVAAGLQMIVNVIDHGMRSSLRPRMRRACTISGSGRIISRTGAVPDTIRLLRRRGPRCAAVAEFQRQHGVG